MNCFMNKPKIIQHKLKFLSKPTLLMLLLGGSVVGDVYAADSNKVFNFSVAGQETVQQNITITGKVTSAEDKLGIPGVNVNVKGGTAGVSTDIDGNYSISVPSTDAVLVFTGIGFKTQEIRVGSQKAINVVMGTDVSSLEEVVVVGYGTQKKATLTGAVEVVSSKAFEDRAVTNVGLALQGQTPGLLVTRSSSRPGNEGINFQIRGATSVNGGEPLVVIDGVPALNFYSFQNMNADDIESISVLKDAAAGIYGARAANGVILVTTKKGKGKVRIDYSNNIRFTTNGITGYSATGREYASLWLAANKEEAIPNWWGWATKENMEKMAAGDEGIYTTQFWGDVFIGKGNRIDEMFAQRVSYQHNLSISNNTDTMGYRLSLGFADNQGNLATAYDGQKQYNFRFNYDYKLSDRVKLETGISFVNAITSAPSVGLDASLYAQDMPFFPAKNPYGQWNANFGNVGNRNAAAATSNGGRFDKNSLTGRLDLKATVNIVKGLNFEGIASLQNEQYRDERYVNPVQLYDWYGNKSVENLSSTVQSASNVGYKSSTYNSLYQYYEGRLKYDLTLNERHNFSAMVGINAEHTQVNTLSGSRAFFTDLGIYDLNAADATATSLGNGGGKFHNGQYAYISRLQYNYDEKYITEVTGRIDGSSKFAPGYKFKNFGSALVGWVFTKEKFLEGISSVVNFGKIRATYGVSGNNVGIGNYDYISAINNGTVILGLPASSQASSSLAANGLISRDREWERVSQKNIGIELDFLDRRLSTTFDYFVKDNKGMLVNVDYPSVLGGTAPRTNNGELNVKGWEAVVTWKDRVKDFSYNVSFNLGDTRSLLKDMQGRDNYTAGKVSNLVGYPLNSWFLYQTDGYFKNQAEVDAYYAQYAAGGADLSPVPVGSASGLRPGDTKRIDLNGDGIITGNGGNNTNNTSDLKYMGDANPHYTFGINLGGNYKGFDLNAFFQGVGKQQIMRSGFLAYPFAVLSSNQPTNFEGRTWTEENPNAEFPRLTVNQNRARWNYANNDFMLENNAYIRLKSLVVGYTLPKSITDKIRLEKVRFYFSGNDLWEASKIKDGYDPEMGETSQNVGYPFYRTLSFGINVGL
jgi:TonB-linked SusC/RagA family outer membrane protein